eukprot:11740_1
MRFLIIFSAPILVLTTGFLIACIAQYIKARRTRISSRNPDHSDNDKNKSSAKEDIRKQVVVKTRGDIENSDACSICLDSFQFHDEIASSRNENCSHTFHIQCITKWLLSPKNNDNSCPVCREDFLAKK